MRLGGDGKSFAREIKQILLSQPLPERAVIGIDGVDGVGKTTFADQLADDIAAAGKPVARASIDGFHNPRAVRYRLGRSSPEGFYVDTTNYPVFRQDMIAPFRLGQRFAIARFDHRSDQPVTDAWHQGLEAGWLIVDGIFLQRPELEGCFDFVVFLDAPFKVTAGRMAGRDGSSADPDAPAFQRYRGGQELYLAERRPSERAQVVVDHTDLAAPRIVRKP